LFTVKELREAKGLKQEDMAKIIGVSAPNYCKKEKGDIKFSLNEAKIIANEFGKQIEEISFDS